MKLGAGMGLTGRVIRPLVKAYKCQDLPGTGEADIHGRWGSQQLSDQLKDFYFDLLVMADCFYRKADFPFLLATIADALHSHEGLEVICIHHHRK